MGLKDTKNAVVIRHLAFEDLGTLADALTQQNYAVNYLEAGVDNLAKIDSEKTDLLIILGGPIGVYDEPDYPFLSDELSLLQNRLKADLPTLGICLGSQLIARALGASVYAGSGKEIGWSKLELTEEGINSPLADLSPENTSVLHWHGDTFDLPVDATLLASTSKYKNQAFSWKKNCLALQFHPEVTTIGLERWFIGHAAEISTTPDVTVTKLRQDTVIYGEKLEVYANQFWQTWLSELESSKEPEKLLAR